MQSNSNEKLLVDSIIIIKSKDSKNIMQKHADSRTAC